MFICLSINKRRLLTFFTESHSLSSSVVPSPVLISILVSPSHLLSTKVRTVFFTLDAFVVRSEADSTYQTGFPWRKVPQYIISQIFGGFIAGLIVYVNYKQPLDTITDALKAAGLEAQIFTPEGVRPTYYEHLALNASADLRVSHSSLHSQLPFLNNPTNTSDWSSSTSSLLLFSLPFLSSLSWIPRMVGFFSGQYHTRAAANCIPDDSVVFASPVSAPILIGLSYAVVLMAFSTQSVAVSLRMFNLWAMRR